MSASSKNELGFAHGPWAKPGAHIEPVFGKTIEELAEFAVQRALENGCTCRLIVHVGTRGVEILHVAGCPRLRTIGGRQ